MTQRDALAGTDRQPESWETATSEACLAEANARIQRELLAQTGALDLDNLRSLDVLPPALSRLQHLCVLSISDTSIVDLTPLAQLHTLQSLECSRTPVSDLTPLAQLHTLQSLVCSRTPVSDLTPLAQLNTLQSLVCSHTPVSDLTPLAQLPTLQSLNCSFTQVSDLTLLAQLHTLQSLNCSFNQASDLTPLAELHTLQSLECSNTEVSDLTPLAQLHTLQSLNCSFTQVSDLTPLAQRHTLQSLDCSNTQVSDLTPLAQLNTLQSLNCSFTQVSDLTPLAQLHTLQSLDCSFTQLSELTPLAQLNTLQSLDCSHTPVSELTPLAQLNTLQSLNCSFTQVSDLTLLAQLHTLQSLDCSDTKVSNLTPLAQVHTLQSLNCSFTQVSDLTPLAQVHTLQSLDCSRTPVSDLTPLAQRHTLQSLRCSSTPVSDLTPLAQLHTLQSLRCSSTPVSDLTPLAQVHTLQSLDCSRTPVSDLTPLTQVHTLQSLDCSYTQVSDLTPLNNLRQLKRLTISGCNIHMWNPSLIWGKEFQNLAAYQTQLDQIPPEVLSSSPYENCLQDLRAHLLDLGAGAVAASSVKLILLGNGTVGKTQICQRLRGLPFDEAVPTTHGIQVHSQVNADTAGEWHIWDFGGQDIYHSTHALFMRTRAVFVLIWSPVSEQAESHEINGVPFRNHPLEYWIDYVRHTAGLGCPLLIVQTRCEKPQDEVRQLPLPSGVLDDFSWCKTVQYSSLNNRGRASLDEALADAHAWLLAQHPSTIGLGRLRVQQALCAWRDADNLLPGAKKQHRLITQTAFGALCAEGDGDVHDPAALLNYLHHAGIVFYQANLFDQQIILDQGWALDAIYAVFDREKCWPHLRRLRGRFNRALLASLVWQHYSQEEQELFLSMMQSCGVAFVHIQGDRKNNIETEYIAPDLLPGKDEVMDELKEKWDDDAPCLHAQVHYSVHQPGLLRSLLAKIGSLAGINGLYWQDGACVYEKNTRSRALIEHITDQSVKTWHGDIRISTQGPKAEQLLAALKTQLERETRDWTIQMKHEPSAQPAIPPTPLEFSAEPVTTLQYGVSYAWTDDSSTTVDRLCEAAKANGVTILRDKTTLGIGDRITPFMQRLAEQERIFVILSEKYLKSPNCMYELFQIWRNCQGKDALFLSRVQVYRLPDADIFSPQARLRWAAHWKKEFTSIDQFIKEHGADLLGAEDFNNYKRMQDFYSHIGDILFMVADTLLPNNFDELVKHGLK